MGHYLIHRFSVRNILIVMKIFDIYWVYHRKYFNALMRQCHVSITDVNKAHVRKTVESQTAVSGLEKDLHPQREKNLSLSGALVRYPAMDDTSLAIKSPGSIPGHG